MTYEVSKEERAHIQEAIDYLFNGDRTSGKVDFTGSSISPYNIKQVLKDNGFEEDAYEQDSYDNWWYFKHPECGTAAIEASAESFTLKLWKFRQLGGEVK